MDTNIHVALSVLQSSTDSMNQVALFQVGLAKAIDRVNYLFFVKFPEHISVGSILLESMRLSYHNCTTSVIINRTLSPPIEVESSAKPGRLGHQLFSRYPLNASVKG